ncbi:transketolase family protein [Sphaerochaeta halotolerans]|jgi:transketolase|uniref:transketolase family protein n=1 Tax=Sphaerochaeta halotolerans TaxID=2293840 RepID=UPI00136AFDF3|nr:transketolase family protein [Sphaerochaeta halotolerans]MDN5332774.1 transketolase [Sphaerochaeta sp.]MXI85204.1 transketolase family protein [Sphaerochaeta halotolerans]
METKEMRGVYCDTLLGLAHSDERIMVLEADLMKASGTIPFKQQFPERAVDVGVAEANMVGLAAGLSAAGKIPFAATFGCFASRRVFDQFFISANYAKLNVKLVGTDPGISAAFNGGTHMPFEDIGLMRMIPNLTILEPSDPVSLKALVQECAKLYGCTYIRLHRKAIQPLYAEDEVFTLGKGKVLKDGTDVTIIALGAILVPEAIKAAALLEEQGISAAVIDMHTVKPLDEDLVLSYAKKTGAVVTAENHQIAGGLGAAVANLLSTHYPTPMEMVGIHDEFGQVGTQAWLQTYYKLTAEEIVRKVLSIRSKS